ncbi:MAG: DUF5615 family PIN-like protein [Nocardioidaceae bacterium]
MRLLVDANLSPVVSEQLKVAGYDASHVYDHDLGTVSDEVIAVFAEGTGAAIISADSDFTTNPVALLQRTRTPASEPHDKTRGPK